MPVQGAEAESICIADQWYPHPPLHRRPHLPGACPQCRGACRVAARVGESLAPFVRGRRRRRTARHPCAPLASTPRVARPPSAQFADILRRTCTQAHMLSSDRARAFSPLPPCVLSSPSLRSPATSPVPERHSRIGSDRAHARAISPTSLPVFRARSCPLPPCVLLFRERHDNSALRYRASTYVQQNLVC